MLITCKSSICIMRGVAETEGAIFMIYYYFVTGSQEYSVKLAKTHLLLRQDLLFIECYSFYYCILETNANTPIILLVSTAPVLRFCAGRREPSNHI